MDSAIHQNFSFNSTDELCLVYVDHPLCGYPIEPFVFELTTGKIISAIAIALLIVVTLAGNILLCTAFFFYRRLRKTTNYFIISLAVSDLLVASISMPIWLSYDVTAWMNLPAWIAFSKLHRFWTWIDILSGVASITNLTAISIDRFFSIMTPLLHRTRMTSSVALFMILVAWLYGIVLASLFLLNLHYYSIIVTTAGFFFPLLVIFAAYVTIYLKVKHGVFNKQTSKDWNLERTLVIVICVFVCCWMPFFVFTLLYHYCQICDFTDHKRLGHIVSFVKWMHYLNSCCNPFIYGFFNTNFKQAFRALLRQCCSYSSADSELTNVTSEARESTIKRQIRSFGRKLKYKRRGNRDSLLLTDVESSSVCVTMVSGSSNRNSSVLNNNIRGSVLCDRIDEIGEHSFDVSCEKENHVQCNLDDVEENNSVHESDQNSSSDEEPTNIGHQEVNPENIDLHNAFKTQKMHLLNSQESCV